MTTVTKSLNDASASETPSRGDLGEDTLEARRMRRMAALLKLAGIWTHRSDIPADGL